MTLGNWKMKNRHPAETELALLAGGDCGRWRTLLLNRHVSRCADCRNALSSYADLRTAVQDQAERDFAPGLRSPIPDWSRMAAEMRANLRVGLAAGECVRETAKGAVWGAKSRWALGSAGVLLLAGAGVFLHGL